MRSEQPKGSKRHGDEINNLDQFRNESADDRGFDVELIMLSNGKATKEVAYVLIIRFPVAVPLSKVVIP